MWLVFLAAASLCSTAALGCAPSPADGVRPFAEAVRIDWPKLTVEVDAEVVLREGPLELFACSPRTREHESILSVPARPMHIYQAMGLIGLNPGKPLRYDEGAKRWDAPTGDRLELRVRYTDEHGTHIVASEQWVTSSKSLNRDQKEVAEKSAAQPPSAVYIELGWLFAGSMNLPDGRFAADADGTIACLVDFESALIALASRHSADNEQLWLVANTTQIPPRGTKCTLLIRSAHRPSVEVDLIDEQTVRHKDQSLQANQLAKLLRPPMDDNRPARLIIHPAANVSPEAVAEYVRRLRETFDGPPFGSEPRAELLVIETQRASKPGGPSPK